MIQLELKFKDKVLKKIDTVKPEISIGRSPNSDIQIDNLAVSRKHARLIQLNGQYVVEDLNSKNGILLNNEKISKAILKHNDIVGVGKHTLVINFDEKPEKPTQDFGDRTVKTKA